MSVDSSKINENEHHNQAVTKAGDSNGILVIQRKKRRTCCWKPI